MLHRVVHLVPYDGVGGVETAVRSLSEGDYDNIEFNKCFLACRNGSQQSCRCYHGPYTSENNPLNYICALVHLFKIKPDIVIASLWRSCILVILLKALRPKTKVVIFLHLPRPVHFVDALCNRLAMRFAAAILVDSDATLEARVPLRLKNQARTISFVTAHPPIPPKRKPRPMFIFWGRLHRQKRLDRALHLFSRIKDWLPDARYTIIGPDGGDEHKLKKLCASLGVEDHVDFLGPLTLDEIRQQAERYSFYLQTSEVEGMAMSVVEAMQLGLVPVVTPVGEIGNYCYDGVNSIVVGECTSETVDRMVSLAKDSQRYAEMSRAAWKRWQERTLYKEDVLAICRELASSGDRRANSESGGTL